MSDKPLETKYYKLEKLCKWEHVDEVNTMLTQGISPHKVSEWCKERGFSISHPKLYEYRDMLKEAISKEITVERLLGIGVKRTPIVLQSLGIRNAKHMVKNELELLDFIIHSGYSQLLDGKQTITMQDAMRAVDLKNKITEGKHAGLTGHGLDQLRELEQAKFNGIIKIVQKYLPEEVHEELIEEIGKAERQFYEERAPELVEEYEQAIQEELDENPDNTIVSN